MEDINYPTVITNNFGSLTTVTAYATVFPTTSWTTFGSSSSSGTVFETTEPTATSYATATPSLITTFVPPASCLSNVYDINGILSLGPPDTSHCYPYGWASSIYFSPGICPQGYTTLSASLNFLNSSSTTETVATCCPSGYSWNGYYGYGAYPCSSNFNPSVLSGTQLVTPTTTTSIDLTVPVISSFATSTGGYTTTIVNSANIVITGTSTFIVANSIMVRHRSGDFSSTSSASGLTSPGLQGPSTPTSRPKNSVGLGIGLGLGLPILLFALGFGIFLWRRNQKRDSSAYMPRYISAQSRDWQWSNLYEKFRRKKPAGFSSEVEHKSYLSPHSELETRSAVPPVPEKDGSVAEISELYSTQQSHQIAPRRWTLDERQAQQVSELHLPALPVETPRSILTPVVHPSSPEPGPSSALAHNDTALVSPVKRKPVQNQDAAMEIASVGATSQSDERAPGRLSTAPSEASFPSRPTDKDENLAALRQKYEKVKEEKERLSRLQELSALEDRLKEEIKGRSDMDGGSIV